MLRNDFAKDLKHLFIETGVSKEEVAKRIGVSAQAIYQYSYHISMTKAYVNLIEKMGYDIEVTYEEGPSDDLGERAKELIKSLGKKQVDLAREIGITRQGMQNAIRAGLISKGFVKTVEALGYGIKINFIARG